MWLMKFEQIREKISIYLRRQYDYNRINQIKSDKKMRVFMAKSIL